MTSSSDETDPIAAERARKFYAANLGGFRALDTFTPERFTITEKNAEAFAVAAAFDPLKTNLYLHGPTGTGKSHLAVIAARKRMSHCRTLTQMALSRAVRAADTPRAESDFIRSNAMVPILVIDDLGVGKDTEFSTTLLYEVIHERYMNVRGGLIVTSNLSLGTLAQKLGDDRISSRLAQMCRVISVGGDDVRLNAPTEAHNIPVKNEDK